MKIMKKTIFGITMVGIIATAFALPPLHKVGFVTFPPAGTYPVNVCNIYKANQQDTQWTYWMAVSGTNGQTVTLPADPTPAQFYIADSSNTLDQSSSDYCPVDPIVTQPYMHK